MVVRRADPRISTGPSKPLKAGRPKTARRRRLKGPADGFLASSGATGKVTGSETLALTQVPHTWAGPLRETAGRTSAELKAAAALLHEGGDAFDPLDPMGIEAHTLGGQAQTLGAHVESLAHAPQVPAGAVHTEAQQLEQRTKGLWARAVDSAANGREAAQQAIDKIGDGATAVGEAVKTWTQGIANAVDYEKNIDALGEGDSYRLSLEGIAMAPGIYVKGAGSIEVEKKNGRYLARLDGAAAAGIHIGFGVHVLGVGAETFAALLKESGSKLELSFATAEEAKSAVSLMLSRAAKTATLRELTPAEASLFEKNLSAVELRGGVIAEGWAMVGLNGVLAAIAEPTVRGDHIMRIELGAKPALVMTERLTADLKASLGGSPATHGELLALMAIGAAHGDVKVSLEHRFPLGKNVDEAAFAREPKAALRALAKTIDRSAGEQRLKLEYEGRGSLMGSGGGFSFELAMDTDLAALKKSGAIGRALKGDLAGAIDKLPPATQIEGRFEKFADYGVHLGPAVYFMSWGAGLHVEALRKDVDFDNVKRAHAPAKDAYAAVKQWLGSLP